MLSGEAREQKSQRWLGHLQAWRARGGSLAAYVRAQGLAEWEAYRWQRILEREGRWVVEPTAKRTRPKTNVAAAALGAKFVRVGLKPAREPVAPLVLRVRLANGRRRVEIRLADAAALGAVLAILDRVA